MIQRYSRNSYLIYFATLIIVLSQALSSDTIEISSYARVSRNGLQTNQNHQQISQLQEGNSTGNATIIDK